MKEFRKIMQVQQGHFLTVSVPELPEGTTVEIVICDLSSIDDKQKFLLPEIIGKGKGCFTSASDVNGFLEELRDEWN